MNLSDLPAHLSRHLNPRFFAISWRAEVHCGSCARPKENLAKCCNYWPLVPNFVVWSALSQTRLNGWLESRVAVLPIGVVAPGAFRRRRETATCPFFHDGLCSIWRFRSSECATYFCDAAELSPSPSSWLRLNSLLTEYEQGLAQWWMLEAGFDLKETETCLAQNISTEETWSHSGEEYQRLWAHWRGRELEFFRQAKEWHEGLSTQQVGEWLGERWQTLQATLCEE